MLKVLYSISEPNMNKNNISAPSVLTWGSGDIFCCRESELSYKLFSVRQGHTKIIWVPQCWHQMAQHLPHPFNRFCAISAYMALLSAMISVSHSICQTLYKTSAIYSVGNFDKYNIFHIPDEVILLAWWKLVYMLKYYLLFRILETLVLLCNAIKENEKPTFT